MSKGGSTKIVNFMTPWGRGSCARIWPYKPYSEYTLFFKKSSSLLPGIDQTNYLYNNDDQGKVYKNCKFHDPLGQGFLWSSTLSIYSTFIAFVLRDDMLLSYAIVEFYFLYDVAVVTYEAFWQEVGVESLILRWPLRPVGLLFFMLHEWVAGHIIAMLHCDIAYHC